MKLNSIKRIENYINKKDYLHNEDFLSSMIENGFLDVEYFFFLPKITLILNEIYGSENWEYQLAVEDISKGIESNISREHGHERLDLLYQEIYENVPKEIRGLRLFLGSFIKLNIAIVVKFPKLKLTDEQENSVNIKDLFAKIIITASDGILRFTKRDTEYNLNIKGVRTTISKKEYAASFLHSHLPSFHIINYYYDTFCTGTDDINTIAHKLKWNVNKRIDLNEYNLFFNYVKHFLSLEASSYNPYIKIRQVFSQGSELSRNFSQDFAKSIISKRQLNPKEIKWQYDSITKTVSIEDNEQFEDFLLIYDQNLHLYNSNNIAVKTNSGEYKRYRSEIRQIENPYIPEEPVLVFKGEYQYLTVEEEPVLEEEVVKFYIRPEIKQIVKNKLEENARKNIIRNYIIERLQSNSNNR